MTRSRSDATAGSATTASENSSRPALPNSSDTAAQCAMLTLASLLFVVVRSPRSSSRLLPDTVTSAIGGSSAQIYFLAVNVARTLGLFGGPYASGCLYAKQEFIARNPNTVHAIVNAMTQSLAWLQTATPGQKLAAVVWIRQAILAAALFGLWYELTELEILSPFFFGQPIAVMAQVWDWFYSGKIFAHLFTILIETLLAFAIGTLLGMVVGLWLGFMRDTALLLKPFLYAMNSMQRVVLAPIFAVWFGLGILSKVRSA